MKDISENQYLTLISSSNNQSDIIGVNFLTSSTFGRELPTWRSRYTVSSCFDYQFRAAETMNAEKMTFL